MFDEVFIVGMCVLEMFSRDVRRLVLTAKSAAVYDTAA